MNFHFQYRVRHSQVEQSGAVRGPSATVQSGKGDQRSKIRSGSKKQESTRVNVIIFVELTFDYLLTRTVLTAIHN